MITRRGFTKDTWSWGSKCRSY